MHIRYSIITPVLNRKCEVDFTLESLRSQTIKDYEHIIQDGGSTDGTLEYLHNACLGNCRIFSQEDKGIYDAINKGLSVAKGELIGLLHIGDCYASNKILEEVSNTFDDHRTNIVYGNIEYFNSNKKTTRFWRAKEFSRGSLRFGWMPPHTSVFVRKSFLDEIGVYDHSYKISGDYEWLLRALRNPNVCEKYLDKTLIRMSAGGLSTDLKMTKQKMIEDIRALKQNNVPPMFALLGKNVRKLPQIFKR